MAATDVAIVHRHPFVQALEDERSCLQLAEALHLPHRSVAAAGIFNFEILRAANALDDLRHADGVMTSSVVAGH